MAVMGAALVFSRCVVISSRGTAASHTNLTLFSLRDLALRRAQLVDVEDNVADEPDGDVDGDASGPASSAQETLFQDADHLPGPGPRPGPGPDAAQQPSKPATPLIKLRGV